MKNKKTILIIMLTIFIFSISSAYAADVNDTGINSQDNSQLEISQNDESKIFIAADNEDK